MIVCVTTTVILFPFPAALSHKRHFLSIHLGGGGESQVKPQQADPEPGLHHGSSLSSVNK